MRTLALQFYSLSTAVIADGSGIKRFFRNQPVMPFFNDFDLIIDQNQFKKSDNSLSKKLRCNRPASQSGKTLLRKSDVLRCLHHTYLVFAAFGLDRYDEVAAAR